MAFIPRSKEQAYGFWVRFLSRWKIISALNLSFSAWQTLAHHQHFMEEEIYAEAMLPVMEAMVGAGHMTQALLHHRHGLMRALSSPVTQFIYITVRPRHDRGYELVPLIEKVREELKRVPGCFGSSWGPSVEKDDVQVGVIGWRCIQVGHKQTSGDGPILMLAFFVCDVGLFQRRQGAAFFNRQAYTRIGSRRTKMGHYESTRAMSQVEFSFSSSFGFYFREFGLGSIYWRILYFSLYWSPCPRSQ